MNDHDAAGVACLTRVDGGRIGRVDSVRGGLSPGSFQVVVLLG